MLREKFQDECAEDRTRFMKPILKRKVINFPSENTKRQSYFVSKGKQVTERVRDLFVHMLVNISRNTNFNLKHIIAFLITVLPLSIAHSEGSLMKTPKYKLLRMLVSMQNAFVQTLLSVIDVTFIDGGLLPVCFSLSHQ